MVQFQAAELEREVPPEEESQFNNRFQCLADRVGCSLSGPEDEGPWSEQERQSHINCLELPAAFLALQTFAKGKVGISVLLRIDNTMVVAYINNQGGTVSRDLLLLVKDL